MTATSSPELQRLLEEAPFVRALASALAARDADDVVQGTWLRVVESGGAVQQPRPWLARVVRSVAGNLRRGTARRAAREHAAARSGIVPSSAELMEREERRRELVQAVDALPEPLRAVVLLRWFDDLPPRAIATRLGVPVTTVWNRLRAALAVLRKRLDERHGDRRAWLLPLLPAALTSGVLAMTAKAKVAAAASVLALGLLTLWAIDGAPGTPSPGDAGRAGPPPLTADVSTEQEQAARARDLNRRAVEPPAAHTTTGALIVEVTYEDDGAPVPDLLVMAGPPDAEPLFGLRRAHTDPHGMVRFADLPPGSWRVVSARGGRSVLGEVVAGAETEITLALPVGILVTGIVVDRDGLPVAGADVYLAGTGQPERTATTGGDGRFALRSCPSRCVVGARAAGHASSRLTYIYLEEGGSIEVRIELPAPGGSVEGRVLGPDGEPLPGAVVVVGEGRVGTILTTNEGAPPIPALARTGVDGGFRAVGIPVGEQPVRVRAAGLAPWTGTCQVHAHAVTPLEITLGAGVSCKGVVLDADGAPVAGADVHAGAWGDLSYWGARSAEDGTFRFDGLPPGEVKVWTRRRYDSPETATTVRGRPGETVSCELRIGADPTTGPELRGRVLKADGEPIASAYLKAIADRTGTEPRWEVSARTDDDGRFVVRNCPEGRLLTLRVWARGFRSEGVVGVDPRTGEFVVRLVPAPPPSVTIRGRILAPDGSPVPQVSLEADERRGGSTGLVPAADTGVFELGPVVAGTWQLCIQVPNRGWIWTEWRELGEGAVWDMGDVLLPVPGTVVVRTPAAEGLRYVAVLNEEFAFGNFAALERQGDSHRSKPLAPGLHYVMPVGEGIAAHLMPVTVKSGEETVVDLELRPGHGQRFEVATDVALTELELRVFRGGELVAGSSQVGRPPGEVRTAWETRLAPGDYTITASGDGLSGRAAFTVREGDNEVVRVVLR